MSAGTVTTPMPNPWDELTWLLATLEDWLLIAEPATIHELGDFLRSIGSTARTPDVMTTLGRLRSLLADKPPL